jgi:hypothetical protein
MLRLVVTHQLVLSLLVGPMLCCCTTARLGSDASSARVAGTADTSRPKHCCGEGQKPSDRGRHAPGERSPSDPVKCPCKDYPAVVAVSEPTAGSADLSSLLAASDATHGLPAAPVRPVTTRPPPRFDLRSSSTLTADLVFSHHNLRC